MNCAIINQEGKIVHFIRNCIRSGNTFRGEGANVSCNLEGLSVMWTEQDVGEIKEQSKIFDPDGNVAKTYEFVVSYDKTADQLTDAGSGPEIKPVSHADYAAAIKLRSVISNLTYPGIDDMVDTTFPNLNVAQRAIFKNVIKGIKVLGIMIDRRI